MAFDFTGSRAQATAALKQYGMKVSLVGASGKSSAYGIFVAESKGSVGSGADSLSTLASGICYLSFLKKAPQPGDTLSTKTRSYYVSAVETYSPADTVIAYKLTVN